MFEAYTYEALLNDVLRNAPADIDTRQGSIFYDAVSGIILQIARMYTDIDRVFQLVFVVSAEGEYLDMKAGEYGIKRLTATAAKYRLVYEGSTPSMGSRFFHNETGLYFRVGTENGVLYLEAEQAGIICNDIPVGDLAVPVNTIQGLISSTFGAVYEYGTDEETDENLRTRVREKIAGPAENGNKQHYKTWCESVDGVGLARITPLWNGPNTVKAVLINPLGLPCSENIVENVQKYVDPATKGITVDVRGKKYAVGDGLGEGVANLGAHFTATAADSINVSVRFTALIAQGRSEDDVRQDVEEALTEYFKQLVMETESATDIVVRITAVGAMISGTDSVIDYSNLTLNGKTSNIYPGEDGVPVVSEVVVDVNV